MKLLKMADVDLADRRVLIREDLNVPLRDGEVAGDARIRAAVPTLRDAMAAGARVMVMSHLGRPTEGQFEHRYSLEPVAARLGELLGTPVPLARDWLDGVEVEAGSVVLCENVRFLTGEGADDEALARRMAALCDVYVMDAFGTAHRAQASTHGVGRFAPVACAGPLLAAELEALEKALGNPARPMVAVVGGAKVSGKLAVLERLVGIVDRLVVGGGIANTFIAAAGHGVGRSLYEPDLVPEARRLRDLAQRKGAEIPIPEDVVTAAEPAAGAAATTRAVTDVPADEMILDLGPRAAQRFAALMGEAATVVWNGPVGVFEHEPFSHGTRVLGEAIAASGAYSLAGGGETVAAIDRFGLADRISYISTGGGAFLEYVEGRTLPAVAMLESRAGG